MGWTGIRKENCILKNGKVDIKETLLKEFSIWSYDVGDYALVGTTFYYIYTHRNTGEKSIVVVITKQEKDSDGSTWFYYKDMDESMHPYYYTCPERLLKQSTCNYQEAINWRAICREQNEKTKFKRSIKCFNFWVDERFKICVAARNLTEAKAIWTKARTKQKKPISFIKIDNEPGMFKNTIKRTNYYLQLLDFVKEA